MDRLHDLDRRSLHIFGAPNAPSEILYLIGENEACSFHLGGKSNFERISLRSVRDRNCHD